MRLGFLRIHSQALLLLVLFLSCVRNSTETPVIPPSTNPLANEFIGYGVVNIAFAHVTADPLQDTPLGFLRKRSLVQITERRTLSGRGNTETWVKITEYSADPNSAQTAIEGWLRENSLNVYDNVFQAVTASQAMLP